MNYPNVLDEWETLKLLHQGKSIARFGDGELNICMGGAAKCQAANKYLAMRLRYILLLENENCVVGIPRIGRGSKLPEQKDNFWEKYRDPKYQALYTTKQYGSAFITRPDSVPAINCADYWAHVFELWAGRNVLLVEGKNSYFDSSDILKNAGRVDRYITHNRDAYSYYEKIFNTITQHSKDTLVLLSLGPTATVLAWDLSLEGYQALDLGHLWFLHKKMFIDGLQH